jgi:hypothetical protein
MADADRLYGLPLDEFTKERDLLAKELRKGGDKDAAATVGKLPKPTPVAWAVNRLARDEPGLIEALVSAGERLQAAQLGGEGRDAVRAAVAEERAAVDAVVGAARELRPGGKPLSRPMVDRLRALLHAVAGDEALRERVKAGTVAEEPEAGGAWPLGAVAAPAAASERPAAKSPRASERRTKEEDSAEREAAEKAAAERRELVRELKAARRDAAAAAKALDRARSDADLAVERLEEARAEVEASRDRLAAARAADESARDEVARLEERLD